MSSAAILLGSSRVNTESAKNENNNMFLVEFANRIESDEMTHDELSLLFYSVYPLVSNTAGGEN